ncbi:MAG: hypothetical protein WCD89_24520 [Anaerocolumna sp.]
MERYENIVKIEEIRKLAEINQYLKAVKILETMDTGKIKALTDLSIIADVYIQNERYDEAMAVLTKIYGKTKTRRVLYQLVDLSIKRGSVGEAEDYLERYIKIAPQDSSRFIFRYYIDKLNGEPYEILIASLEQLKEYEYYEIWAYELAKLYHKAGMKDKCVRECSDIILWFGDGIYVEKAKLLKGYYVGEINPLHMLKAKEKKEAEKKLGLDKTKDYSNMRSQIDQFLAEENEWEDDDKTGQNIFSANKQDEEQQDIQANTEKDIFADTEKANREDILNKDPELEAFYKKVAKKLEKEIVIQNETVVQGETEEQKELEAEKETVIDYETTIINPVNEEVIVDREETGPYAGEGKVIKIIKKTVTELDDEAIREEINMPVQYTVQEEEQLPEQNTEIKTDEESRQIIEQEDGQEALLAGYNDKLYLAGKFDSIFSEAGMNYERDFSYFIRIDSLRKQIESCLESILSDHTKINHMIITGKRKSGKTILAKKISKALYRLNWINTNRVAKISAGKLNGISLESKKDKLVNSSLIIEGAGLLDFSATEQLISLIQDLNGNIFVILEDDSTGINKLLKKNPKLREAFSNTIQLPEYKTEDLFGFAFTYIHNNDYEFTRDVKTAFIREIEKIINSVRNENQLEAVMDLAHRAKTSADERNKILLSDIIRARELSSEDFLYINKEDFL